MRSAGTVLGMVLIAWMLFPITPPTDYPGHGLDGKKAHACQQTCDEVVAYHDAISTANGYGHTYYYAKLVWMDNCDLLARARVSWVEHVNEDCTNDPKCSGFGPAPGCTDGGNLWQAKEEAEDLRLQSYIDMEDAWDDWRDGVAICGVIKLVMMRHCQSHGHSVCDWEPEEPVR